MASEHHKLEEMVGKFRQVEVLVGQGQGQGQAVAMGAIGVTEPTYCRSSIVPRSARHGTDPTTKRR